MLCTALLLQHVTKSFFGDHCKYGTFRRWVTTAEADFSILLQIFFKNKTESQQLCVDVGEKLCIVFGIIVRR